MMKIADGIEDGGMSSGNTFGQTSSAARIEYISKVFFCFDLVMIPGSVSEIPARIFNSVDLPAPLTPTRPILSRLLMRPDIFLNKCLAPY